MEGGRRSVVLTGDIDLASMGEMDALAKQITPDCPDLELDVSGVTFIDSTGLSLLVVLHQGCAGYGGKLTLKAPSEPVARLLHLTCMNQVFTIECRA